MVSLTTMSRFSPYVVRTCISIYSRHGMSLISIAICPVSHFLLKPGLLLIQTMSLVCDLLSPFLPRAHISPPNPTPPVHHHNFPSMPKNFGGVLVNCELVSPCSHINLSFCWILQPSVKPNYPWYKITVIIFMYVKGSKYFNPTWSLLSCTKFGFNIAVRTPPWG